MEGANKYRLGTLKLILREIFKFNCKDETCFISLKVRLFFENFEVEKTRNIRKLEKIGSKTYITRKKIKKKVEKQNSKKKIGKKSKNSIKFKRKLDKKTRKNLERNSKNLEKKLEKNSKNSKKSCWKTRKNSKN